MFTEQAESTFGVEFISPVYEHLKTASNRLRQLNVVVMAFNRDHITVTQNLAAIISLE